MRELSSCPYYEKSQKGFATCQLVTQMTGLQEPVPAAACQACCTRFEPSRDKLNPVVASLVHAATDRLIQERDVPASKIEEAQKTRRYAEKFLDVVAVNCSGDANEPENPKLPCFYRREQVGERKCESCFGNVRIKEYRCQHPLHDKTTVRECRTCPDYDAELGNGPINRWAVGVTTAIRSESTLEQSLASLRNAGWEKFDLFAEPGINRPPLVDIKRMHQRETKMGAWPNFFLALSELILREPDADAYLMCQDDVLYTRGLRAYLEAKLWPSPRTGVVSLHTPMHKELADTIGFYPAPQGWAAWGAQAMVFSNASARALLSHPRVVNHRSRGPGEGLRNVDSVVGQWCADMEFDYHLHSPSPTQHVGEESAIWSHSDLKGRRSAASFPGEHVHLDQHMENLSLAPN